MQSIVGGNTSYIHWSNISIHRSARQIFIAHCSALHFTSIKMLEHAHMWLPVINKTNFCHKPMSM